jgi:hypothetical protein
MSALVRIFVSTHFTPHTSHGGRMGQWVGQWVGRIVRDFDTLICEDEIVVTGVQSCGHAGGFGRREEALPGACGGAACGTAWGLDPETTKVNCPIRLHDGVRSTLPRKVQLHIMWSVH